MLRITLSRLGSPEHVVDLRDRTLRIGRGAGNEILLKDPEKSVSRTHGEVRREAVGWVFIDNDSQNGSWIEGRRVDRVVLRDGVAVSFGDYELTCEEVGGPDEVAARAVVAAPPGPLLGSEDQTQLASDVADAATAPRPAPSTGHRPITGQAPIGPSADDTPPAPPPAKRADTAAIELSGMPTVFAPSGVIAPALGAEDGEDADAKTIVVPGDAAAPIPGGSPPAADHDDLADLPTIVVPTLGAAAPDADAGADAATIVVPSLPGAAPQSIHVEPPPPVSAPASWFEPAPPVASRPAGDRPTALGPPPSVFPITPGPDSDVTMAVPGDLSELFKSPPGPPAQAGAPPGATTAPAPAGPLSPSFETEDVATVLIPGRPPTGQQLVSPPRPSGERPLPPPPSTGERVAPPVPAAPPSTAPAPFAAPAFEPPPAPMAPAPTAPVPVVPPSTAAVPSPAIPPAVPPPVTAVASAPVAPAPPAPAPLPPARAQSVGAPVPTPRPASAFRPAVLIWGIAWLLLFGLVAAGVWIWMSSRGSDQAPPAEAGAPAAAPDVPATPPSQPAAPATESAPAPVPIAPVDAGTAGAAAAPPPAGEAAVQAPTPAPPTAPVTPPASVTPRPAAPEVWVDRPPPAATAVPRRPGERAADYRDRVADLERQYATGRDALAAGRAVEARDLLRKVAAAAPGYKDVDGLLADAEAAVRREGMAAKSTAERLEQAGEYEKALAAYRRAEQFGVPSDQVAPGLQRVQQAMRAAGEKAFSDARQFDSLGRNADAARLYEIAVRYLPEGDPRRAQARQRLDVLAAKRP